MSFAYRPKAEHWINTSIKLSASLFKTQKEMGGSAFSAQLSAESFPRIPPPVYRALKAQISSKILELYSTVDVPIEAPEKRDHGDLDILVCNSQAPYITYVPHDVIKSALGAEYVIAMHDNRTSNYAVPIANGEWASFGHAQDEEDNRKLCEDGKIYYQIDIHPCVDSNEFDRILFFHSYGDLGMILGLLVRNIGLHLSAKGLRMPDPPNAPLHLSNSFVDISQFLGLSYDTYQQGFKTSHEIFEWASSTRFFDSTHFRSSGTGIPKVKPVRTMYADFVEWINARPPRSGLYGDLPHREKAQKIRQEALTFFNKKDEFDAQVGFRLCKVKLKEKFSGTQVRDWTELGNYWKGVKIIMDEVRKRLGGEGGVCEYLEAHSEESLKAFVLQVQNELGIKSRDPLSELLEQSTLDDNPLCPEEEDATTDHKE